MKKICFVVTEIYPTSKGGIARYVFNHILHNYNNKKYGKAEIHILLPEKFVTHKQTLETFYKKYNATIHTCTSEIKNITGITEENTLDNLYKKIYLESLKYYSTLAELENKNVIFDFIEFQDLFGLALASLQAKASGIKFGNTLICIKHHSSLAEIIQYEPYIQQSILSSQAGLLDTERESINFGDKIIISSKAALKHLYNTFVFKKSGKEITEFPQIVTINKNKIKIEYITFKSNSVVFSTRIQGFKRPEIFIEAKNKIKEDSKFQIISYFFDENYFNYIKTISENIDIRTKLSENQRIRAIENSIIVIPSEFETFCFFAYESSFNGNIVILNEKCIAFNEDSPWKDNINCIKFNGTSEHLAEKIDYVISKKPKLETVNIPKTKPYWLSEQSTIQTNISEHNIGRKIISQKITCFIINASCWGEIFIQIRNASKYGVKKFTILSMVNLPEIEAEVANEVKNIQFSLHNCTQLNMWDILWEQARICQTPLITVTQARDICNFKYLKHTCAYIQNKPQVDIISGHTYVEFPYENDNKIELSTGNGLVSLLSGCPPIANFFTAKKEFFLNYPLIQQAGPLKFQATITEAILSGASIGIIPEISVKSSKALDQWADERLRKTLMRDSRLQDFGRYGQLAIAYSDFRLRIGTGPQDRESVSILTHTELNHFERLHPFANPFRWGEPVSYNEQLGGVMVHPAQNDIMIGRMKLMGRRPVQSASIEVHNVHDYNAGFEVAAILSSDDADDVVERLKGRGRQPEWKKAAPRQQVTLHVDMEGIPEIGASLYVATRTKGNQGDTNCQAVIKKILLRRV